MTAIDPAVSPGAVLRQRLRGQHIELGQHLWGFGGLHGGLALALLTSALEQHAEGAVLRGVGGRFHRTIRDAFTLETAPLRTGRTLTTVAGRAVSARGVHLDATATFGPPASADTPDGAPSRLARPVVTPTAPPAPPPDECDLFIIPTDFAPIGNQFEIRPVGPHRPYTGGDEPELTAWVRLVEDDEPPDAIRLVFLMDALAPSYAAVLSDLTTVPTVELSVRPSDAVGTDRVAGSPWVLLHARTHAASASGWVDEQIDAWGLDATYLGSAHQLRVIRTSGS